MTGYEEGTNGLPKAVEDKLVEAKNWYDRRVELERTIQLRGGNAQRNQEDRDEIDREAAGVLESIVEAIDATWGFGPERGQS